MVVGYKDTPGEYETYSGKPVGEKTAREAGFDVDSDLREKKRRELYADARSRADAQVEREFGQIESSVERELESESNESSEETEPTALPTMERSGPGVWSVIAADGAILGEGLSKKDATRMVASAHEG